MRHISKGLGLWLICFSCFKFHPVTLTIVTPWIPSLLAWKLETSTCYAIIVDFNGQAMVGTRGYDSKARGTLVIFLKTLNRNLCSNFLTQPPDPDLQVT